MSNHMKRGLVSTAIISLALLSGEAVFSQSSKADFWGNTFNSISDAVSGKLTIEGVVKDRMRTAGRHVQKRTQACLRKGYAGCMNDMRTGISDGSRLAKNGVECWGGSALDCVEVGAGVLIS